MRAWGAIVALSCAAAQAAGGPAAIYDPDPGHLWNRIYHAIAVRTEAGKQYGADSSQPFRANLFFDDPAHLAALLDEFLQTDGQDRGSGDLKRALFLHDVWTAFDTAVAVSGHEALQRRLAGVIGRLRMSRQAIARLPDNYAAALKSGALAADFDPAHPEKAFLPPDLFDPEGAWVQIGESGLGVTTPTHVTAFSGRSVFMVFIRCPGGREATLSYLEKLNLHRTPWALQPADIGTRYPDKRRVRMDERRLDPATPQFPPGTVVALLRQMMVVDENLEPVPTPITQSVQLRVYRKIGNAFFQNREGFPASQSVSELTMRRVDLLAGRAGGLHQVTDDETEHQLLAQFHSTTRAEALRGPVVLSTCGSCHNGNGILSVNTYTRLFNFRTLPTPQLLPAGDPDYQRQATASWKKEQFNWGLLRGLLTAND
jgi:hypothetical protein